MNSLTQPCIAGPAQASEIGNTLRALMQKAQRTDGGAMLTAPLKVALRRLDEAKAAFQSSAEQKPAAVSAIR